MASSQNLVIVGSQTNHKKSSNFNGRTFYNIPGQYSSKLPKSLITKHTHTHTHTHTYTQKF
jgi:hypothetical protein